MIKTRASVGTFVSWAFALAVFVAASACGSGTSSNLLAGTGDGGLGGDGSIHHGDGCVPNICVSKAGIACGSIADGCGGSMQCGSCTGPETCGGGSVPGICGGSTGCIPKTCASLAATCGSAADGCGNALECGTCTGTDSCGGGGVPNACGRPGCTPMTCAQQGFDCGMATDGCGNMTNCGGACATGQTCGATMPNVCGSGATCKPGTCASQGFNCGAEGDGCGNVLNCGACPSGDTCGGGATPKPGVCGTNVCTPATCASQGFNCGAEGDTCGGLLSCGTCPAGQTCGGGSSPKPGVCGATTCAPKTCASQGFNCGGATDGCGNILNCGTCLGTEVCGAATSNVCGGGTTCTGLCLKQQACGALPTTSVTGKVYAPNGTDPLYNVLVYVPNSAVQPFTPGVTCGTCGADVSGSPLVSTATAVDGSFTLTNMPVGTNIPLVIQNGRWRRQFAIPSVGACTNTALPTTGASQLRMPRTKAEGDIPLMGFVTGSVDALECVLRKVGIADTEFSDPSGTGRVRFYQGSGGPGATYSASTPSETTLWGSQATIDKYDMVYFACQGDDYEKTAAQQQVVIDYANSGGRVFATHYSYVWLYNDVPFSTTADWAVDPNGFNAFATDPQTGYVNTTFPRGQALAQWLFDVGASTIPGQISLATLRNDFTGVVAPSLLWLNVNDATLGNQPMHYTFDTPVGAAPANQCGRVLFSDFHVEDAVTSGLAFPTECTAAAMTPQEKMLEFMIFDLGSCVAAPTCTPKTCAEQGATCGPVGDGCGNILQCGGCPSGLTCSAGTCTNGGCTPETCASQNFTCGQQGDGCGNVLSCGTCTGSQACNAGTCSTGACTPKTCAELGVTCGPVGDGCGNILQCGSCATGQTCGGAGVHGACGTPPCTPKNCVQQNFNCGSATDTCGNVINCGTCTGDNTCGGGGTANQCGGGAG